MVKDFQTKLFIPGEAGQLEALFSLPVLDPNLAAPSITTIGVICHPHPLHQGTMQNKVVTTIEKSWQQMGISTLRFNFRGVGLSEGKYGEGIGEQKDLCSVFNWLLEHHPKARFFLGGFSFGAFVSSKVASLNEYPINALLSVAPPLRFFSFTADPLPEMPWIIIQGVQDELVFYQDVLAWYEEIKLRKKDVRFISIDDATHFFHGKLIDLKTAIISEMKPYL